MRELLADKRKEPEIIETKERKIIFDPSQINPLIEWQKLAGCVCLAMVMITQGVMAIINTQGTLLKIIFSFIYLGFTVITIFPISWQIKSMKRNRCYVYGTVDIIRYTNCHHLSAYQIERLLLNIPKSSYIDYKDAVGRAIHTKKKDQKSPSSVSSEKSQ